MNKLYFTKMKIISDSIQSKETIVRNPFNLILICVYVF